MTEQLKPVKDAKAAVPPLKFVQVPEDLEAVPEKKTETVAEPKTTVQ